MKKIICVCAFLLMCGNAYAVVCTTKIHDFDSAVEAYKVVPLENKQSEIDKATVLLPAMREDIEKVIRWVDCDDTYDRAANTLAAMNIDYAEKLIEAGKKVEAKKVLRNLIINFTGDNYRGYIKKAEFMLEDLKSP